MNISGGTRGHPENNELAALCRLFEFELAGNPSDVAIRFPALDFYHELVGIKSYYVGEDPTSFCEQGQKYFDHIVKLLSRKDKDPFMREFSRWLDGSHSRLFQKNWILKQINQIRTPAVHGGSVSAEEAMSMPGKCRRFLDALLNNPAK